MQKVQWSVHWRNQKQSEKSFLDHAGYVRHKEVEKSTGHHYNMPGHSLSDMTISVLEQIKQDDPMYRKRRESYHIAQFDLVHNGVNRKRWRFANCNTFLKDYIWSLSYWTNFLFGRKTKLFQSILSWHSTLWWSNYQNYEMHRNSWSFKLNK